MSECRAAGCPLDAQAMMILQCSDGVERLFYCLEHALGAAKTIQVMEGEAILLRSYGPAPVFPAMPGNP